MGLIKINRADLDFAPGPTPNLRETIAAGFSEARETMWTKRMAREEEALPGANEFLDGALAMSGRGELDLDEQTVARLVDRGRYVDRDLLFQIGETMRAQGLDVPADLTPEAYGRAKATLNTEARGRIMEARETMARAPGGSRIGGALIGGFGAAFTDPINLATLPLGAPARAGLAATMAAEAALNAGLEALQTPGRNIALREMGLEEESALQNAAIGALFGAAIPLGIEGAARAGGLTARQLDKLGRFIGDRGAVAEVVGQVAEATGDAELQLAANALRRDQAAQDQAVTNPEPDAVAEHETRLAEAERAINTGEPVDMPPRPVVAQPAASILNGALEEVSPRDLLVQPEVFQFKSATVAEGGVTEKLLNVRAWEPSRAGIIMVYEYADGSRAVADGHQRTALASRIMAETGQDIRLAAYVLREVDGFTPEDVRVAAAMKNIAEAADGMTVAMARDAAKVLRVKPDEIQNLPAGPGIVRAKALMALSEDAFGMLINDLVPDRFAELIGRLVDDKTLHASMMQMLARMKPDTVTQAESLVRQALAVPVQREVTLDLFGEAETARSLFMERAKVMERAMKMMREDRSVFRTLDEQAQRIEATGENRLDAATNRQVKEITEQALAAIQKLAYRAGPISEALNDGARTYADSGRLKDAAQRVVDAVRSEITERGIAGLDAGRGRPAAAVAGADRAGPALEGFSDPVNGPGVKAQIENTRMDVEPAPAPEPPPEGPCLFDEPPPARAAEPPAMVTEATPEGQQGLFEGVAPITEAQRLQARADQPMGRRGPQPDQTQIGGLFDPNDPARFDLFDTPPARMSDEEAAQLVPIGERVDADGTRAALTKTRAELEAELLADEEAAEIVNLCVRGEA